MGNFSDILLEAGFSPEFKPVDTQGEFKEWKDETLGKVGYFYEEITHPKGLIKRLVYIIWNSMGAHQTLISYPEGIDEKEHKKIRASIDKKSKIILEKLHAKAARAALEAQEFLKKCLKPTLLPAYLAGKKLDILNGYLIDPNNPEVIHVPLFDREGVIASYQTIFPDNSKHFLAGGKIQGSYGFIEGNGEIMYFCEGFATAASIHLATRAAVVFILSADNFVDGMYSALKRFKPAFKVVACDDDIHLPENKGFQKAFLASNKFNAILRKPNFKKRDGKNTTDFDDLRREEGLNEVSTQLYITQAEKEENALQEGVYPLGFDDSIYFLTSTRNESIQAFKSLSKNDLFKLMPENFWQKRYGEETPRGLVVQWESIASDLYDQCHALGQFDTDQMRGVGVYQDQGRTIVHLGNKILVDGKEQHLRAFKSEYMYVFAKQLPNLEPNPMDDSEARVLWSMIEKISLKERNSKFYLAGWLVCAILGGSLQWRPHLYLSGLKGTGKTTILNFVFNFLNRGFKASLHDPVSGSAAGVRQSLRGANIPVILDEAESDSPRIKQKVEDFINLFRVASSNTAQGVVGTPSQKAIKTNVSFCGIIAGISPQLKNEQDWSRFSLVEATASNTPEEWFELEKAMKFCLNEQFARRFAARIISNSKTIVQNIEVLTNELMTAKGVTGRLAQQYGALYAGSLALRHTDAISEQDIEFFKKMIGSGDETVEASQGTGGAEDLLDAILDAEIFDEDNKRTTVRREIIKPLVSERMREHLGEYGVLPLKHGEIDGLHIRATRRITKQLESSPMYQNNFTLVLKRIKGAQNNIRARFQGKQRRGVWFPMDKILDFDPNDKPDKAF